MQSHGRRSEKQRTASVQKDWTRDEGISCVIQG